MRAVVKQVLLFQTDRLALIENTAPHSQDRLAVRGRGGEGDPWRQVVVDVQIRLELVTEPKQ